MTATDLPLVDAERSVPNVEALRQLMCQPPFVRRPARCRCAGCGEPLACDAGVFAPGAPLCPRCDQEAA